MGKTVHAWEPIARQYMLLNRVTMNTLSIEDYNLAFEARAKLLKFCGVGITSETRILITRPGSR